MFEQKSLYSSPLGRSVTLHIFVPDDCCDAAPCPVLYLHDGDIYYEDSPQPNRLGSLRFREYYEAYRQFLPRVIIVGIEPPSDRRARTAELSPYTKSFDPQGADFDAFVCGKGKTLAAWIIHDLKPFIDGIYPTFSDPYHTAIGGFSSGALNAMYCAMTHSDVFGRLLMQSPAFHLWLDELLETMRTADLRSLYSCYMDIGTNDFTRMTTKKESLAAACEIRTQMLAHGLASERLRFFAIPDGRHSPASWRLTFPDALRWTFRDMSDSECRLRSLSR